MKFSWCITISNICELYESNMCDAYTLYKRLFVAAVARCRDLDASHHTSAIRVERARAMDRSYGSSIERKRRAALCARSTRGLYIRRTLKCNPCTDDLYLANARPRGRMSHVSSLCLYIVVGAAPRDSTSILPSRWIYPSKNLTM